MFVARIAVFAVCLFFGAVANASDLVGKIVGVSDGDTATMLIDAPTGKLTVKIRLAQIDAPEKAQPWGQKSKQALSDLIFNKVIRAQVETKDRYGRVVANLYDGNVWINEQMVATGNAWMYRQYSNNAQIEKAESLAKQQRVGLWALPDAERVPPWDWRRKEKSNDAAPNSSSTSSMKSAPTQSGLECGTKRTCSQMTSCSEARFYLEQCRVSSLDRDKDGIPCESICR